MIEAAMYVALGFCTAGLIGLAILPAFYRRAARLTEEALRAVNPASYTEVKAAQDQERARYAVELRRVETRLDNEREKAARFHLEASRLRTEIEQQKRSGQEQLAELEARLAEQASDQHAVDLLSAEIKTLKEKLSDSEKALAESWTKAPGDASGDAETRARKEEEDSDWLPATDTMTLATITGLEAEVATLRSKLARYEPTVAGEVEASMKETAKSRLAELEAQLVDTESKYVSAQAEVTRLSLMLDAANATDAEPDQKLQAQLRELTGKVAGQQSDLQEKDRALQRMTSQMRKLRDDLAAVPELKELREDFRALSGRLSEAQTIRVKPEPAATENLPPPETPDRETPDKTAAADSPSAAVSAVNGSRSELAPRRKKAAIGSAEAIETKVPKEATSSQAATKTADIASAAEALVSRIMASSRNKGKPDAGATEAASAPEPASEQSAGGTLESKSAKQKKKDVA